MRANQPDGERTIRWHGYYTDHEKLARDATDFPGDCFVTINCLDPKIPATNALIRCRKGACTRGEHIVRRSLLYLDVDPARDAGTSSTEEQHQSAIDLVRRIAGEVPFPQPLIGSSGNGANAFWKIDLPPDSSLVKQVLKAVHAKFQTPGLNIDLSVASLSRIGRLLGTDNFKGGRRGRQSAILDAPVITTPAENIVVDGKLELLTESVMEAFAPLPKQETEKARVQQLVTSWSFGKTPVEQVAFFHALLKSKRIPYDHARSPDSHGVVCDWFHFDCVLRPGHNDARNWIKIHPTDGVSGGCHHAKCRGKGMAHILVVIALSWRRRRPKPTTIPTDWRGVICNRVRSWRSGTVSFTAIVTAHITRIPRLRSRPS